MSDFIELIDDTMEQQLEQFLVKKESNPWKILVVDDDESVHTITKIILKDFRFQNSGIDLLHAYSEDEAVRAVNAHADIAIVLLDVVMENDDSGFRIVKHIRETLNNKDIRIVLRTGQPGQAPEKDVVVNYDINDYKLKTELTSERLFVTVWSALKSYNDLLILNMSKNGMENIVKSTGKLFSNRDITRFVPDVLEEFSVILDHTERRDGVLPMMWIAEKKVDGFYIEASKGTFMDCNGLNINELLTEQDIKAVQEVISEKKRAFLKDAFVAYFESSLGQAFLLYIGNIPQIKDWEKVLVELFCSNIGIAFDNLLLTGEIASTQKEIIYTLGEVAEHRSNETGYHVKRVAEYCRVLALELGMSKEEAELLAIASSMHDVGKIAIPDHILNKPGKLTFEEFETIKTHVTMGYDMLKKSNGKVIKMAALIALHHHEKYNGKGYPNGLKGEEIHLYGRIVAIADVYDALTSKRIYKDAWPVEEVIELLKKERGEHFDPILVDIFLNNIDKIEKIRTTWDD